MRRRLTPEERALWRHATRDATPLERLGRQGLSPPGKKHETTKKTGVGLLPSSVRLGDNSAPHAPPGNQGVPSRPSDPFTAGDPKMDRLAQRGRIAVDGVFDLHGHSQASARAALYGFILKARANGWRCVLVITGKGAPERSGDRRAYGRGILRERFREWLSEGEFRQHIIRASPAHARHGGAGAFYVFMKRAKT